MVRMNGGGSLSDAEKYKVMQITPNDASLDAVVAREPPRAAAMWRRSRPRPITCLRIRRVTPTAWRAGYTAPDNAAMRRQRYPSGNVQGHVADALAAYDPPTKAELDAAVAPLALEAGLEAHVLAVLNSYDPPTRGEATADKAAILAAVAALNDLTVGEILGGDLSDSLSFPANSLADLVRKLFWVLCNRLVITDASGAFTAYKTDGVTPARPGPS